MLKMAFKFPSRLIVTVHFLGIVVVNCQTTEPFMCILCHSYTDSRCEDPQTIGSEKMQAQVCTDEINKCYVQFGARNNEVDRGCYNPDNMVVVVTCNEDLCNSVPGNNLPLISKRTDWFRHLRGMDHFMKNNLEPLRCVSCESHEYRKFSGSHENLSDSSNHSSRADICYNIPQDRVSDMLITCNANETCVTVRHGRYVSRGCSPPPPQDSLVMECGDSLCNNHAETALPSSDADLSLYKIIKNRASVARARQIFCLCLLLSWY